METQKLFQAIDDASINDFKEALAEGVNVNAFDEEGMTPLMNIAYIYTTVDEKNQSTLRKMATSLIGHKDIIVNAQSMEPIYRNVIKTHDDYPVFLHLGREVVYSENLSKGFGYKVFKYLDTNESVVDTSNGKYLTDPVELFYLKVDQNNYTLLSDCYGIVFEQTKTSNHKNNTALHICCNTGNYCILKILLTHPNISTNTKNYDNKIPENCITRGFEDVMSKEFKKAKNGKVLLQALVNENIDLAEDIILNRSFNPNCWERVNGGVKTIFDYIIDICLKNYHKIRKIY